MKADPNVVNRLISQYAFARGIDWKTAAQAIEEAQASPRMLDVSETEKRLAELTRQACNHMAAFIEVCEAIDKVVREADNAPPE